MQKKIIQEICNRKFDFGDHTAESVLEFLYIAYAEIGKKDNAKIEQGFAAVDRFCEGKTFEESTAIFNTVCDLCIEYEQRAFADGLQFGMQLMKELQE